MKRVIGIVLAAASAGCSMHYFDAGLNRDSSQQVMESDRRTLESHTLSSLAAIERSLNDFAQRHHRIPKTLNELVPDFLAEIPAVELGLKGYKNTSEVSYYDASVIIDGEINGAAIDDKGGWGYAHNDRQVIVFVDSTRKRMDGTLWYRARGVY